MYTLQRTPFCLGDSGDELGVYASKAQAVASLIVERRLCNKKIRWEFARNLRIQLPEPILTTLGAGDQTETEKAIVRWLATGTPSVEMVDLSIRRRLKDCQNPRTTLSALLSSRHQTR